MTTTLSPLQARAARLRELYDAATPETQHAMTHWLYSVPMSHTPESAASLLLAALEAEQEPPADRPDLWYQWIRQAKRDGIPHKTAVRLLLKAAEISRQIYPKG